MADHSAAGRRSLSQWLTHIESVHFRSVDLTLDRVRRVLHRVLPRGPRYKIVSVAGTNGKGSAVEMLTSIYAQTDLVVGTYTSPHLVSYTERIRVDRKAVAEPELCAAFEKIEHIRSGIPLTYFEFGTLAALLIFQDRGVQIALLEVGMGGRLDAVNAVEPAASLITSIAIDHQSWLGSDRASIAAEKAGVMRQHRPTVCSEPDPPPVILRQAEKLGSKLYLIHQHFSYRRREGVWNWVGPDRELTDLPLPPLTGGFQLQNAAGALMVVFALNDGIEVSEDQIRRGISSARLRGRFEVIAGEPMIVLDVAHNLSAVSQLRVNLEAVQVEGRTLAVCGMLKDKPAGEITAQLESVVDAWYLGAIRDARGCAADELEKVVKAKTKKPVHSYDSVLSAYRAASKQASTSDRILVFGSFHTVGDIIPALEPGSVVH